MRTFRAAVSEQRWMVRVRKWLGLSGPDEMFGRIRNRLTISYSGMLMLFLVSFIVIVYVLLFSVISSEQRQQIQDLASTQLQDYVQQSDQQFKHANPQSRMDRFFSYVVANNGQLLQSDEADPTLRSAILDNVKGWTPTTNEVRYIWIDPHRHNDDDLMLMAAGRPIVVGNEVIGMLYVGKDVTFYKHTFLRLGEILGGLVVLFLLIASLAGHFMAKRAMVPIASSFLRQREFVADASHELRTPLAILKSAVEVIELEEEEHLSEFSQKVLLDMKDEVDRMSKLVADLLTLARSDSGQVELITEAFDVVAMAEQLERSFQHLTVPRGIVLKLDSEETLTVYGDKERLQQLLYILLDNAIKFMSHPGNVMLSLHKEREDQQDVLLIRVQDEGIGIDPEQQRRIFDRFYRGDKIRSREIGGTGLGLAIAKWIVEAHRGTISVTSTLGEGSTFTVRLPQGKRIGS
ncbi:MAG: sensor histidine kinase [Tumebacillaceae bacterium]